MPLSKIQTAEMLDTPNLGRRNLIINGDMRIAQRGTSFASSADAAYLLDRFKIYTVNSGDETVSQSTDVPTGEGFIYSLKLDVTGADTSIAAGDYLTIDQIIEGQNLTHLHWGTSNAKSITVSFWVKSTLTGTYCYSVRNHDITRSYVEDFTVNAANTWEKKTLTIQGDTTGTWLTTSGIGQIHQISTMMGTTFIGVAGWQSGNAVSTNNQVNLMNSTDNELYITGWQVEVGDRATPFEHRSYGEELELCQRYYEQGHFSWRQSGSIIRIGQSYHTRKRANASVNVYYDSSKPAAGTINVGNSTNSGWNEGGNTNFWNMEKNTGVNSDSVDYNCFWTAEAEL